MRERAVKHEDEPDAGRVTSTARVWKRRGGECGDETEQERSCRGQGKEQERQYLARGCKSVLKTKATRCRSGIGLSRSPGSAGIALFALIGVNFERHVSLVPLGIFGVILKHHVAISSVL